jgi:hypothetical protein
VKYKTGLGNRPALSFNLWSASVSRQVIYRPSLAGLVFSHTQEPESDAIDRRRDEAYSFPMKRLTDGRQLPYH